MENRILFDKKETVQLFFRDGQKYCSLKTQSEFCKFLDLSRGHFWKYYACKLTIPQALFDRINNMLPPEKQALYAAVLNTKPGNWGAKLGGKITYSKHPEIYEKGRNSPRSVSCMPRLPSFDINQDLSIDLCEFLGTFSGDGFTNVYNNRHYQIGFAGDKRYDKEYYEKRIIPIAKSLFNIQNCTRIERDNGMWVNFHSKTLFQLLTQRFNMPAGVKFDKVRVPKEILEADPKMKAAFIRGCMDTDGCVFFDKRPTYKAPYMRLDLCMYNPTILDEIKGMLAELGIPAQRLNNNKHLQITSKENVRKYLEIIGSSNRRHINKILKMYSDFEQWNPPFS